MKINAAFLKSLLVVTSLGLVAPMFAKPPAKPASATTKQEEPAKAEGEEAEPTIPGTVLARKNGGYLSLTIEGNVLKLAFFDAKKKQVDADVARASAWWNPKNKKGTDRFVLNPSGDGKTLVSPPIQPPYNFILHLTLLNEADEAVESFNQPFQG